MNRRALLLSWVVAVVVFAVSAPFFQGIAQERQGPGTAAGQREPSGPEQDRAKDDQGGPADVPLRHLRRRGVLGRRPASCTRPSPARSSAASARASARRPRWRWA